MYCNMPTNERGILFAADANISNGIVVITPAPTIIKSVSQPLCVNEPVPE